MNESAVQPEHAWLMVLEQLRSEMSRASFDTWVSNTCFAGFDEGLFNVATPSNFGQEWLTSRLTSTVNRMITAILGQPVEVKFVIKETVSDHEYEIPEKDNSTPNQHPSVLSLQAEYQSIYDEIIRPDQVIVIPGYFLRYIPMLGLDLAWLYVGFHQAGYEAGASRQPGKKLAAPAQKVAKYAGMSLRTFRRYSARPDTWKRLHGLVTPVEEKPSWQHGNDNHPHRTPRCYRVAMTLPLTHSDELSLRAWLYKHLAEGKSPLAVVEAAVSTTLDELIPWQENTSPMQDAGIELHSVQEVLQAVCGPISGKDHVRFQELADRLAQHLMPPKDLVVLTHYFVTRWLPKLGHGQGLLVVLLRDRCYINPRSGEIRDEVQIERGYAEIAGWLGVKRVKTVWEWLHTDEVTLFVREMSHEIGDWKEAPRRFKVCLGEPMTEIDQTQANKRLAQIGFSAVGTIRRKPYGTPFGAVDTHDGATDTITGAVDTVRGETIEDPIGAIVTHNGASGSHSGGNGTHKVGADGTYDWREWHSLNSLALGLKHTKNTQTTPGIPVESGSETGVVDSVWDPMDLLTRNRVSSKNRELLLKNGLQARTFISWLLYAASPNGNEIRNPVAFTVSRLIQDPSSGASSSYDQLARLPATELAELLVRELGGRRPWNPVWRTVMENAQLSRLQALADQLGISVPDSGYR